MTELFSCFRTWRVEIPEFAQCTTAPYRVVRHAKQPHTSPNHTSVTKSGINTRMPLHPTGLQDLRRCWTCAGCVLVPASARSQGLIRDIARNIVAGHDLLHLALILGNVIPIALAPIVHPVLVSLIELLLVFRGEPALELTDVVMMLIPIRGRDGVEWSVGRDVIARHDFFHLARV